MNLRPVPNPPINLSAAPKSCPSKTLAVLGFPVPIEIPCGKAYGHDGAHEYRITWGTA